MPGLLKSVPIDDALRRSNDRHQPRIVLGVLGLLLIYVYLFTQAADPVGLRLPAELAWDLGIHVSEVFDDDGNVESNLQISMTDRLGRSDDERLVFFAILAIHVPIEFGMGDEVSSSDKVVRSAPVSLGEGEYVLVARNGHELSLQHIRPKRTSEWKISPKELRKENASLKERWPSDAKNGQITQIALARWSRHSR